MKLPMPRILTAGLLAGTLLAGGLVSARSRAQTAEPAPAPATRPAQVTRSADQPSARDVAARIDDLILQKLELQDLNAALTANAAEADRRLLIRRLTLDLAGRPPTNDELKVFLAGNSADAKGKLINQLLAEATADGKADAKGDKGDAKGDAKG